MIGSSSLHLWLIPLIPFVGFALNGLLSRRLTRPVVFVVALASAAAPLALTARFASHWTSLTLPHVESFSFHLPGIGANSWLATFTMRSTLTFLLDPLSLIMVLLATGICLLAQIYSFGAMRRQPGYERFSAYLCLLLFFMLVLVLADNFLMMFVGWEGTGLASYLLIGFHFHRDRAANAAKKAFIVGRVGDAGFLLAMFLMIAHFGALSFTNVFPSIARRTVLESGGFLTAICLLLLLAATAKSAQIPLYTWLPGTSEQPAPASALMHSIAPAAAGIYLLARAHVLYNHSPVALETIVVLGAATALFAATIALVETDIYRVLGWSTISQFGLMFLAAGAAVFSTAIFHLITHALFKAALLLAAGSVVHALGGEQDMRFMGGMRKTMPITFLSMTAATLAIIGIPPFAGFFSTSEVIYAAFESPSAGPVLGVVALITVFVTSYYMFRIWYLVFFGKHSGATGRQTSPARHSGLRESSWIMLVPLVVLALASIAGGWISVPRSLGGGDRIKHFISPSLTIPQRSFEELSIQMNVEGIPAAAAASAMQPPEEPPGRPREERVLSTISVLLMLLGWYFADFSYRRRPGASTRFARRMHAAYAVLINEYWIEDVYSAIVTTPVLAVSRRLLAIEKHKKDEAGGQRI